MEKEQAAYSVEVNNAEIWHLLAIFIILSLQIMQRKEMVLDLPCLESELPSCRACQLRKQSRLHFSQSSQRATEKLQLLHTDLAGPLRTPSLKGSKYYIAFIDGFNRMCWIYCIRFKSEVQVCSGDSSSAMLPGLGYRFRTGVRIQESDSLFLYN